jgi:hypothetical protein
LIRNGRLYTRFAEKLSRINVRPQTTNLGVGGSNPSGRANKISELLATLPAVVPHLATH